jgi:hypothetical protein
MLRDDQGRNRACFSQVLSYSSTGHALLFTGYYNDGKALVPSQYEHITILLEILEEKGDCVAWVVRKKSYGHTALNIIIIITIIVCD